MLTTHILFLAIIQGLTEFLPISSSSHLILVPKLLNWPDQGLVFDVAVHVGTLGAVIIYFYRDILNMFIGVFKFCIGRKDPRTRIIGQIIVATFPILLIGFFLSEYIEIILRSAELIGWSTILFGIMLYVVDKFSLTVKKIGHLSFKDAFLIGLFQIIALIPGTSRSGITITVARFLGYEREASTHFSMLLSIPTIGLSGVWLIYKLKDLSDINLNNDIFFAALVSFVTAIISISFLMSWVRRSSFTIFAVYRVFLGSLILMFVYLDFF